MLESRAQRSALGTAPDRSVVDVGLNFSLSENLTELLKNHMSNKQMARVPSPSPISHKKAVSICTSDICFGYLMKKSEALNRIRIII